MSEISTLPFVIAGIIAFIANLIILIASIVYLIKNKSAAGWLMALGSLLMLLNQTANPIINLLFAKTSADPMNIVNIQGALSIATGFFHMVFAIGFVWAIILLKRAR